jgi:hypothetical protein
MDETKKCRMCQKDVDPKAKKCPHCRSLQSKIFNPIAIAVVLGITYFVFMGLIFNDIMDTMNGGNIYDDYPNALSITESELKFTKSEEQGPLVTIIGKIKNSSDVNWERLNLQATCFNEDGEIIDVKQERDYDWLVPKNKEIPFKISFPRTIEENEYAEHRVVVISAEDADRY